MTEEDEDYRGMSPQEEALDLIKNPLPPLITVGDRILPMTLWLLDKKIEETKARLVELQQKRQEALGRAVEIGVMEVDCYTIEKEEVRGDRVADPNLLRKLYPELWQNYVVLRIEQIKTDHASKAIKEIDEVEKKVLVGVADKIFGKKKVTECSVIPISYKYVVKKNG